MKISVASDIIIVLENKLSNFAKENGMKHLKKILLAVLILALMTTAVVVTALADDGDEEVVYTGTVEEARKLLDEVSVMTTNEEKSAQLKKVHKYVFGIETMVDPYEDGFEDLMLDYSNATLQVAQGFLKDYKNAGSASEKETLLARAYSHYSGAPVYEEYESLDEDGYNEWQVFRYNYTVEAVKVLSPYLEPINNAKTLDARYEALKVLDGKFSPKWIYFALPNDDDTIYEIPGLNDFVDGFNTWCMVIASDYIDTVTTPAEMTAVRAKYISSNNAFNQDPEFFNGVYLPLVEKMDLNIIKYANQLLDNVTLTEDNYKTEAPVALQAVYTYIEKTPCVALSRAQLADTVGASHEALQMRVNEISYQTALYYYAEVEKLVGDDGAYSDAVADFVGFIKNCPAMVFRPVAAPGEYTGDLAEAEDLLLAVRGEEKEYLESFAALSAYLSVNAPDPSLEGAKEFYNEFAVLKLEVSDFVVSYLADLNSAPTVAGGEIDEEIFKAELEKLAEIAAFLNSTPVSSSAVTEYNKTAAAFLETMEKLWFRQIEYKESVKGEATGDLAEAISLLEAVDITSEDALEAYALLCAYLTETPIDLSLEGATEFYEEFAILTGEMSGVVISALDELDAYPLTEDEDGNEIFDAEAFEENLAALIEMADYLEACPVDSAAVLAYNAKASEFMASFKEIKSLDVEEKLFATENFVAGDEAAPIFAECKALLEAVKENTSERLSAYSELYAYLKENAISPDEEGASFFYSEYTLLTANIAAEILNKLATVNSNPLYFEVEFPGITYAAIEPLTYGGNLTDATVLLNKVRYALGDADPDAAEVMAAYAALAEYVQRNSVPKDVPGADKFYADYENVKVGVTKLIVNEIKAPETFVGLEYELDAHKDVLAFIRDFKVSKEAVAAYNAYIAAIKSYVADDFAPDAGAMDASLEVIFEIADFLKKSPISIELVTSYNEVLHGYTKALKKAVDARYSDFVSVKAELEAYVASWAAVREKLDFTVLPEELDYEAFEESISALEDYVKVKAVADYIYTSDLDAAGKKIASVDEYREDFVKTLNDIIAADLLVYTPLPKNNVYSGSVSAAQAIIDRYNAESDVDLKAEIYAELFEYMKNNAMNPKLNGYADVMADFNAIGEEVYTAFIAKIDAASDKAAAMEEMRAYLEETPISEAAFSAYNTKYLYTYNDQLNETYKTYADVMLKLHDFVDAMEDADALFERFEDLESAIDNYETLETLALVQFYEMKTLDEDPNAGTISVTARGGAVKILNNYIRKYPIGEESYAYAETMADVSAITDAYKQLVEDAKAALDDKTPLEDYENDAFSYIVNNDNGSGLGFTHADPSVGTMVEYFPDTARGGMYARYSYGSATKNAFLGKSGLPGTIGFVIEFDLTGDNGVTQFTFNRLDRTTGSAIQQNMFSIKNNCFIYNGPGAEKWQNKEVITPGEWTKFIFVYDPVNITLTGYIDYELVGTWSVRYAANPDDPLIEVRFNGAVVNTSFNIDNFMIYSGSNYRILDKYESMSAADEFEYFVNYMNDETRAPTSRLQAYQKATGLLEEIKTDAALVEQLKDAIEKYNATDIDKDIIAPAKAANLEKVKEYGARLGAYEGNVNTQNYAAVQLLVDELEAFIANNSEYIDKSNDAYKEVSSRIARFKSLLDRCNNVTLFVNSLSNFNEAYTLAAKTKYYANIVKYYELAQLYRPEIRLEVMSDPAILEFEAKLNAGSFDEEYVDIFTYYEECGKELDIQKNKENSKRIIDCIGFVTSLDGYEDSEAFWEANFDYINKYMTIIRDVIRTNSYDASFEGVEEAIAKFRIIDVYFYASLQEDHIAFISEQLDKYASSASYIDKLGICTYVSNYIEANDIDLTNATLAALVLKNEVYLSELEVYENEFVIVLEQNTVKFVNIVEEMKTQVGYKALSELYEEALNYYYEMNITPESQAAIEVFESYYDVIRKMEEDSALFVGYANAIGKARNDSALFKALVNCKAYRDLASSDIDGVSEAIEAYTEALNDYNARASEINGDIAEVNGVVSVARTTSISGAVMSVINNIFNR